MFSLWMLMLFSGVRCSLGLSLSSAPHRHRYHLAAVRRFRTSPQPAGGQRPSDRQIRTMLTHTKGKNEEETDLSWLTGEDSKGPYRLAFRHILPSNTESDGGVSGVGTGTGQTAVLFCNGFRSVMKDGTKIIAMEEHCQKRGWEFCAFDYRGHGLSSGVFEECTLTDWIQDTSNILDDVIWSSRERRETVKRVILVGSSMGAWISIHLALRYNEIKHKSSEPRRPPISGILCIAAGPDFLQAFYSSSTEEEQIEWKANGVAYFPSRYGDPYPISWSLVEDAAQNWGILPSTKPIASLKGLEPGANLSVRCPVWLLHGKCDDDVPWEKSVELSRLLKRIPKAATESNKGERREKDGVILTLIDDGDHRLSRPQDIDLILATLNDIVTSL